MLELGQTAAEEHAALGRFAAESGVQHLVAIGEYAAHIISAAVAAGLPSTRAVSVTTSLLGAVVEDSVLVTSSWSRHPVA